VAAHKRANIVSGLTGVEAVIRGLFGVRVGVDGSVVWRPAPRPTGTANLKGMVVHGRHFDFEITRRHAVARVDGKRVYAGAPREVAFVPSTT